MSPEPAEEQFGELPAHTFDEARFKDVLGHFPTGVTIVTALEEGVPVGFTCQAFTSLSLEPPMVALGAGQELDQLASHRPGRGLLRQHPGQRPKRLVQGLCRVRG